MIRLNCFFQAKKGKYNEALEAAILLTAKTQQHEGVISYDVFESATRKDVFMFCETWESEEALAKHSETLEPMVIYRELHNAGQFWVRPAAMWNEIEGLQTKVEYIVLSENYHEIQVGDDTILVEHDDLHWK